MVPIFGVLLKAWLAERIAQDVTMSCPAFPRGCLKYEVHEVPQRRPLQLNAQGPFFVYGYPSGTLRNLMRGALFVHSY